MTTKPTRHLQQAAVLLLCASLLISCTGTPAVQTPADPSPSNLGDVIPRPLETTATGGTFSLSAATRIWVRPATEEVLAIGQYLADRLRPATGFDLPVAAASEVPTDGIYLTLISPGSDDPGNESYALEIAPELVTLGAVTPAGLFYGVQTIRQLLPPAIESAEPRPGPWTIGTGKILDAPRFRWRGAMLDVARHFFSVRDVTRYIDLLAYYKINRLHLHLSEDQGWRIEIKSWPNLTLYGGSLEVGGTPGGYYSQDDYAYIVAYARSRYITVVPEIDMPGHVNAALASYPELNCDGVAPPLHTGIQTGFSSLCIGKDITYVFVEDVIGELAALTPGPYIHVGGDEAQATRPADYIRFIERVQSIVEAHGKQMVGWEEITQARLLPSSIAQHWNPGEGLARQAVQQGVKVIMSPADKAYMDMKYNPGTSLGLEWAGHISVRTGYDWDPAAMVAGVTEADILGVEAPLWSETLETIADIEYMAFPRLIGYAEIGWSPQEARNWEEYRLRLAAHGPRLEALEVNFYRSPEIPWP